MQAAAKFGFELRVACPEQLRPSDEIVDWVGIEYSALKRDQVVASLMVLGAESVKSSKRSPEYWETERRWAAGGSSQVMAESASKVNVALGRS